MRNQKKIGIILTYITQVVKILVGLIYTPVMLSLVGQSEYGLYEIAESVVSYLVLINLGFLGAYARYYTLAQKKNVEEMYGVNGMFMLVLSFMSVICVAAGMILVGNIELFFDKGLTPSEYVLARKLMIVLIINMAVSFPAGVFEHNIAVNERFFVIKIVELLKQILNPFIALPILVLGYGSMGLVVTTTVITITAFIFESYYCFAKLKMKFFLSRKQLPVLISVGKFSFFILLNQIIDLINWNIDKVIIGRYLGSDFVAVYSVGGQLRRMYSSFPNAIRSVFQPQMYKTVAAKKDDDSVSELFLKVGRIQCLVLLPILIGFICLGKQFIILWTGNEYSQAYYVAVSIMIPCAIPHMQDIGIDLQRALNRHQTRSIVYAVIAMINLSLTIPLTKTYGIVGAAIATGISLIVGNGIFMNIYYSKALRVDVLSFWKKIITIILPEMFIGIVFYAFCSHSSIDSWFKLVASAVIYLCMYLISVYVFFLSNTERKTIIANFRRFL